MKKWTDLKIGAKIFLGGAIVAAFGALNLVSWLYSDLKPRYREAAEESLLDFSVLIASLLSGSAGLDPKEVSRAVEEAKARSFYAPIYELARTKTDVRIYLTDDKGKVVYHSESPSEIGADYSRWLDVALSLKGGYGARTTRDNENDAESSVLYVASPILKDGKITGVASVGKPVRNLQQFMNSAKRRILLRSTLTAIVMAVVGLGLTWLLTRPLKLLTAYARAVRDGKPASLPRLPEDEIGELGTAFDEMRQTVEGKRYMEEYVQSLTHEFKSPLSAIRGAAELLAENPPEERREKFLSNIQSETARLQQIIDRLLQLSSIESLNSLRHVEEVELRELLSEIVSAFTPTLEQRKIACDLKLPSSRMMIEGDGFLLRQCISNLADNAIDFAASQISVSLTNEGGNYLIKIEDDGPGIPAYGLEKIFERFYSLPRPGGRTKSSGLGLNFCQQVARLHDGSITVSNKNTNGAQSILRLPQIPKDEQFR